MAKSFSRVLLTFSSDFFLRNGAPPLRVVAFPTNKKTLYYAIYPYVKSGGCIFVWDMSQFSEEDLEQYRVNKNMAAATCKDRNKKIDKEVYLLPTSLAKMYRFDSAKFYEGKDLK